MATITITEDGIKYRKSNPLQQITIDGVDYELDVKVNETSFTVGGVVDDDACNEYLQIFETQMTNEIIEASYYLPYPAEIDVPENMRTLMGQYGHLLTEV